MPDRKPKREAGHGVSTAIDPAASDHAASDHATKTCAVCGRTMTWRKSWARNWESVKFCSDGCRKRGVGVVDAQLEAKILELLGNRGAGKTICPSEAARAVAGTEERAAWEPLMEPARAAARRLVAQNRIIITQGGHAVDPSTAKGPIRLRWR